MERHPRRPLGGLALALAVALAATPLLAARPAAAETGGPDSYGYVWVDSRVPSPIVPYNWLDIVPTGTRLSLGYDDCTFELPIGFQFRFYGTILDRLHVCANGFLSFTIPSSYDPLPPIPDPANPNDRIVGLGMNLDPSASGSGGVYIKSYAATTPRRFVVTWDGVYKELTTTRERFQIILEQNQTSKDGRILFQYRSLASIGTPLVGIENRTGSSGLPYPNTLSNDLAVAFLPPSDAGLPPDTLTVAPASLAPGSTVQGAADVPMLRLDLTTASNEVDVAGVRVELTGLGADPGDVAAARLWRDDGDGTFSAANDTLFGGSGFSGTPPTARMPIAPSLRVSMGAAVRVFVTYSIAPGAGVGDWVGARMGDATFVEAEFPDTVAGTGFPFNTYVVSGRTQIDASVDTVLVASAAGRMPAAVAQWEADVPALSLAVDADRNLVDLAGFRFSVGGGAAATDLWLAKLVRDADRDGNYTRGMDEVLAVAAASGGPPSVLLSFAMTVAAGSPVSFLVFTDIGPAATVGAVVNLTLDATGVLLAVGSADLVGGANLPAASGDATIQFGPRPRMDVGWTDLPPSADGTWGFGEHLLGPAHTADLDRPIGNGVPGLLTVENNATMLFVAVDALADPSNGTDDGLAIGFDTDGNGAPTNGADDVFVANATGGAHLRYNAGAAAWTVVSACAASGGNVTTPACAAAYGRTEMGDNDHRFYEFAIPLDLLGVPTPVPMGTSIRFAVAAPPHRGLVDGGNRSTWPLLYPAAPPMGTFADLWLAAAPVPNTPPTLSWTGEPGYVADGLEPETADAGMPFRYRITYADVDNNAPALGHPRVRIYKEGVEIAASPVAMTEVDPGDTTYLDGKLYVATVVFPQCLGNYTYGFTARDAHGAYAAGAWSGTGPVVTCPNFAPTLSNPGVLPSSAPSGTSFTYRVAYADSEDTAASFAEVRVRLNGSLLATQPLLFAGWLGAPGDYAAGAWYEGSVVLVTESSNYTFQFRASDGNTAVTTDEFLGPQVAPPPPHELRAAFVDSFPPLEVDEGARNVPFFRMFLYTLDPDVNVTDIRLERTGDLPDREVANVTLYEDVDLSTTLSAPDVRLGQRPPLLRFVNFTVDLRITPAMPVGLLVFANLTRPATADAQLGFEVAGPSSFIVDAGDVVAPFAPFRSTIVMVNVAPRAQDIRMDGFAPGEPGASHILNATPQLSWSFQDDNGGDVLQGAYNVSVYSISPPGLVWFRNESTSAQGAPYAGPPLVPGGSYVVQVRVFDDRLWSNLGAATFRRNTPPAAPALASPADLAVDVDPNVTIAWSPVTDADGDAVTYTWWVSDNPGFTPATSGVVAGTSASLALARDTPYYWKVGASDGWEFAGNATIWRFTTAAEAVPVRGEVRGRVVNGTTPISGGLVELLAGTTVVTATLTPDNGTFALRDLDLRAYTVRVSAFGFRTRTLNVTLTLSIPVLDLGDIALTPIGDGNGGDGENPPPVAWLPIAIPAVLAAAALVAFLLMFRRRRSRRPAAELVEEAPSEPRITPIAAPVRIEREVEFEPPTFVREPETRPSAAAETPPAEPEPVVAPVAPEPEPAPEPVPPEGTLAFECPLCGRRVAADTRFCLCGAEFEA